jgi:hypothetical protein
VSQSARPCFIGFNFNVKIEIIVDKRSCDSFCLCKVIALTFACSCI